MLNKNQDEKHRSVGSVGMVGRKLNESSGPLEAIKPLRLPINQESKTQVRDMHAVQLLDRASKSSAPGHLGTEVASTKLLSSRKLSPKHRDRTPDLPEQNKKSKSPKNRRYLRDKKRRSLVFSDQSPQQQLADMHDGGKHQAVCRRERYLNETRRQGFDHHQRNLKKIYRQPSAVAGQKLLSATAELQPVVTRLNSASPKNEAVTSNKVSPVKKGDNNISSANSASKRSLHVGE